ncbi:MAG: hypothetical protein AAB229_07390 [Candidatus Hydrogenedentota bacterium]
MYKSTVRYMGIAAMGLVMAAGVSMPALADDEAKMRVANNASLRMMSDEMLWVQVKVVDMLDRPIARAKVWVNVGNTASWKGYTDFNGMINASLLQNETMKAQGQTVDVKVDHYRYLKNGVQVKLPADTLVSRLDFVVRLPRNRREMESMQSVERGRQAAEGLGTIVSSPGQIWTGMADAYNRNGPVAAVVVGPVEGAVDMTTGIFRGLGDFLSAPFRRNSDK